MTTPQFPDGERAESERRPEREQRESLGGNPYADRGRRTAEIDLDANAPQLRDSELRRMNRRALFLLGAVVLLLLFVAYWMVTGAGRRKETPKPRDEKVTVAEAPNALRVPQLPPQPVAATAPAQPIPLLPYSPLPSSTAPPVVAAPRVPASKVPTLLQRRIAAGNGEGGRASADPQAGVSPAASRLPGAERTGATSAQPLPHAGNLMQRGTYIRCVLETRIASDIPGFTTCLVTEPVYSFNGHTLLLPKGSKLLGAYSSKPHFNRMEVIWDRIITPTGIDVDMKSPGMDNLGGAGLPGHYDAHWTQRISSALLISMLSDAFKYEAAERGPRNTTVGNGFVTQTPFESNTAHTMQRMADLAMREATNRPPTVTINQGTVIYVYVARDVNFSGVVARF
ncbi:MAG TPA: TrbI/VirB10 family protein [Rhodanobacter sp.]|nr:TrbI/VirB10 family protein [Rhodanobacter sp.]